MRLCNYSRVILKDTSAHFASGDAKPVIKRFSGQSGKIILERSSAGAFELSDSDESFGCARF